MDSFFTMLTHFLVAVWTAADTSKAASGVVLTKNCSVIFKTTNWIWSTTVTLEHNSPPYALLLITSNPNHCYDYHCHQVPFLHH
jgi:hypothetical protein